MGISKNSNCTLILQLLILQFPLVSRHEKTLAATSLFTGVHRGRREVCMAGESLFHSSHSFTLR